MELLCGISIHPPSSTGSAVTSAPNIDPPTSAPSRPHSVHPPPPLPLAVHGIIQALCRCLEDPDMNAAVHDTLIIPTAAKLLAKEDSKYKKSACKLLEMLGLRRTSFFFNALIAVRFYFLLIF